MQVTGKIDKITIDHRSGKLKLTLSLDEREWGNTLRKFKNEKLDIEIDKQRNKRSSDANSYCWVLCDKIAKALTGEGAATTKEDVYKNAITQIGKFEPLIVTEIAYNNFKRIWEKQGLGFVIQKVSNKDKCVRVNAYYGSSTYNTKEMSLLICWLVDKAKAMDIETKSEADIRSLLESWR